MLNTSFKPSALFHKVLLIILIWSGHQSAIAEDTDTGAWHQIEYIIFQHLNTDAHILRYEDTPYPKQQQKQFSYLVKSAHPLSPFHFTRLDTKNMQLGDALKKLTRRRDIKVLDYGAWQQELISDQQIAPIKITKDLGNKKVLQGMLQIKKSRFTHADFSIFVADIRKYNFSDIKAWFLNPQPAGAIRDLLLPLDDELSAQSPSGSQDLYFNIQYLKESRRIKQGEVHYLDHPTLGVIVTINAIDPPEHAQLYGGTDR